MEKDVIKLVAKIRNTFASEMPMFYSFVLPIFLSGCTPKPPKITTITGVFTTFKPRIIDRIIIEKELAGYVFPLPAAMVYLRKDGTYVMGFCDNQVNEAGRFKFLENSVWFYDRYNLEEKRKVADRTMCFDRRDSLLYFTRPDPYHNSPIRPNGIIPLKRNHRYAHMGFLRGQEMSLDSLLHYYQQWPIGEQNKWSDSVWHAKYLPLGFER